ncbi:elongation factor 1-alpha C-terminal domain-related protein, partial [Kineococcus sp. NUM-3379]
DLDVGRGDLIVSPGDQPVQARELVASVCWMSGTPLRVGDRVALKHTTRTVRAIVQRIADRLDPETLDTSADPAELALNDIGTLTLRTSSVVLADPYAKNRETGAFILVDEHGNDTVGAGTVLQARDAAHVAAAAADAVWHPSAVGRDRRAAATGQRGGSLWLTGLPAPEGAALAAALERALLAQGRAAYVVDSPAVQQGLCSDLTDAPGDRIERTRRLAHLARLFADAGTVAVAAAGEPGAVRALHTAAGLPCAVVDLGDARGGAVEDRSADVHVAPVAGNPDETAARVLAALDGHPLLRHPQA